MAFGALALPTLSVSYYLKLVMITHIIFTIRKKEAISILRKVSNKYKPTNHVQLLHEMEYSWKTKKKTKQKNPIILPACDRNCWRSPGLPKALHDSTKSPKN